MANLRIIYLCWLIWISICFTNIYSVNFNLEATFITQNMKYLL